MLNENQTRATGNWSGKQLEIVRHQQSGRAISVSELIHRIGQMAAFAYQIIVFSGLSFLQNLT